MARSESPPARRRRDSSTSSSCSGGGADSDSSNSSKEAVPSKKAKMSTSPPSKRKASPPSRFRDDRRRSSRSPRRDERRDEKRDDRRERDRDERRRDDRRRDSPPRRDRRSPPRRSRSPRRDRSPPRGDRWPRDKLDDRDRRDRSRDRDRRRSPARNDRGDGYGLSRREGNRDVKEEPRSPQQSQLMKARDNRRNEQGEGKQKWGTKEMWDEEERKREEKEGPPKEKEKVNMGTSGALASDTNTFNGVVIKYNEPQDAKVPNIRWRLYQFKDGDDSLPCLYIHRQSAYLIGRDRKIADLPVDHPSCSKQHAVLQYRSVSFEKADGSRARRIRPYIIDLGSANGTLLNGKRIDPSRYIELKEKDVLKFGFSSREYVILTENALEHEAKESSSDSSDVSSDEEEDDDTKKKVKKEEEED